MKKAYIDINVTFDPSKVKEDKIIVLGKKYKGKDHGSGFSFVTGDRDISFEFTDLQLAAKFCRACSKLKHVQASHTTFLIPELEE